MTMPKTITALFFVLTTFICYGQNDRTKEILQVKAEITGKGNPAYNSSYTDNNSFFVKISLINNTDSVVIVYIMKCSWYDSWLIDNDSLSFGDWGCDNNYPMRITLIPKSSLVFYNFIHPKNKNNKIEKFKLGFIMFNLYNMDELMTDRFDIKLIKAKKIYWSDEIQLRLPNNLYKIETNTAPNSWH